ncbi:hypothetical protein RHGRI_005203 [Rhododendron griersonianum]|uniref:Uncharacterized protein n=1 Tax=Rhododendron griersonianum TaxID=479676 RepID=A0AAV6LBS1_9ERIC|nr:hypothetical protein RHGRI_005203 [Rhododendron griersonianum]
MAAALNRFISRSSDKCRPFFQLLKKREGFEWGAECEQAFQDLKKYLAQAPLLSTPDPGEILVLYLAVFEHAVSAVLLRDKGPEQIPVYYVSKTLLDTETRYLPLEKLVLALRTATRKLPHYFQSHKVVVYTEFPLRSLLRKADFSGRISTWSVELSQYDIDYQPRTAIKGQVLADFVAEFSPTVAPQPPTRQERKVEPSRRKGKAPAEQDALEWKLFVDGSACNTGSGIGIVLFPPGGVMIEQSVRLGFSASNNVAEYEALLVGLNSAKTLKVKRIRVYCDSQLVVNQLSGEYEARNEKMAAYVEAAKSLLNTFERVCIEQINSGQNSHADSLAWLAAAVPTELKRKVAVDYLAEPSIGRSMDLILDVNQGTSWLDPIVEILRDETLPTDKKEAHKIKTKSARFWLSPEGKLYKKSFTGPYLLCVHPEMVQKFLHEIHEGTCGSHAGGRSIAHRAITQGYWWPHMQEDAKVYVKICEKCQKFSPMIKTPAEDLVPLTSPWPFAQWGMDIVGPLHKATGNRKFLLVATDYFTKWIEAEPLAKITKPMIERFVWKSIITRFGVPYSLITDNGAQFQKKFKTFVPNMG